MKDFDKAIKILVEEGYKQFSHQVNCIIDRRLLINNNGDAIDVLTNTENGLSYISEKYFTLVFDRDGAYVTKIEKKVI